jgi:hypothetical protein
MQRMMTTPRYRITLDGPTVSVDAGRRGERRFPTSQEADAAYDVLTDGDRPGEVDEFIADQFLDAYERSSRQRP